MGGRVSAGGAEGVDYIPSVFEGRTIRKYPDLWELVIEELDPTRPPGQHRARGGYRGNDAAMTAYHDFWGGIRWRGGDHQRTIIFVQIWSPVGADGRANQYVLLKKKPEVR
jgi:hypothetical protein